MTIGVNFEKLTDPGERYAFGDCLGAGVFGTVLNALDSQAGNKKVAIKVQKYSDESKGFIEEEYKILRDFTNHLNLVDFYGIFKRNDEIWFVLEVITEIAHTVFFIFIKIHFFSYAKVVQ